MCEQLNITKLKTNFLRYIQARKNGKRETTSLLVILSYGLSSIVSQLQTRHFHFNTLRTGDADLRFYITTVQDG